jgi:LytS/YehU family sensor histidine kinase
VGALITLGVNATIAVVLWVSGRGPLDVQMVYSQAIGISIWALTNSGALLLSRPDDPGGFPRGWRIFLLVPGATLAGIVLGTQLGDWYAHQSTWALSEQNPQLLGKLFSMCLAVGLAMTLYFFMEGKKNYLQAELERTQRQATQAQLALLQSQLEPHMLFNTLANLRVLIALEPERAQTMLDHLIAYLRATLSASRHTAGLHPLSAEFDRLGDYLALMAIRMGPRLHYTLDLPDALKSTPVPPLLLQPLVENAILHGLEPQVEGGHITVSARQSQGQLQLQVVDTGIGLPAEPSTSGSGFGLTQVRERLATLYGPLGELKLEANFPCGTCATASFDSKLFTEVA